MRHVLLVEDHLVFCKAYAVVLAFGSSGDVILEAGSLAEARALFGTTTVDMAILDLTLPDGSGFELIPEIRAVHPHAGVAILTASTNPIDLDQARVLGVRLLHKTAALAQLRGVIEHLSADGRMEWRRSLQLPRYTLEAGNCMAIVTQNLAQLWTAQIERAGVAIEHDTFETLADAQAWCSIRLAELRAGGKCT